MDSCKCIPFLKQFNVSVQINSNSSGKSFIPVSTLCEATGTALVRLNASVHPEGNNFVMSLFDSIFNRQDNTQAASSLFSASSSFFSSAAPAAVALAAASHKAAEKSEIKESKSQKKAENFPQQAAVKGKEKKAPADDSKQSAPVVKKKRKADGDGPQSQPHGEGPATGKKKSDGGKKRALSSVEPEEDDTALVHESLKAAMVQGQPKAGVKTLLGNRTAKEEEAKPGKTKSKEDNKINGKSKKDTRTGSDEVAKAGAEKTEEVCEEEDTPETVDAASKVRNCIPSIHHLPRYVFNMYPLFNKHVAYT